MSGIPGSGKSYTAFRSSPDDALIFSTDEFWGPNYDFDPKLLGKAHAWNQGRVEGAIAALHHYIVVDNTNTTQKEKQPYIDLAKKFGYKVEIKYPESRWWQEIAPRIKNKTFTEEDVDVFFKKNTHGVPFFVIKNMMERFEFSA